MLKDIKYVYSDDLKKKMSDYKNKLGDDTPVALDFVKDHSGFIPASKPQIGYIKGLCKRNGLELDEALDYLDVPVYDVHDLTSFEASKLIDFLGGN